MNKYPKSSLRYGDKDDGMAELYIDICEAKDAELYITYRFYCYLINYYTENIMHKEYPIYSSDIWPYINHYKAALLLCVNDRDDKELKKVKSFVLNKFLKENDKYLDTVNKKYFELIKKVPKSEAVRIDYEERREWSNLEPEFGVDYNGIFMSLEIIRMRTYYNALMENILKEEAIEKRKFVLGIILAIVGTALTIFFGLLTFL